MTQKYILILCLRAHGAHKTQKLSQDYKARTEGVSSGFIMTSLQIWQAKNSRKLVQFFPFPKYVGLHVHVKDPTILLQSALTSQSCDPSVHSSASENKAKDKERKRWLVNEDFSRWSEWIKRIFTIVSHVCRKCKFKCNLFTHGALRSSQELVQECPCIPGSNCNLKMLVLKERGKPEYPEKNLSE